MLISGSPHLALHVYSQGRNEIHVYSHIWIWMYLQIYIQIYLHTYGVAPISRLLQIIGLFCKRALYKRLYSTKESVIWRSLLIVATPYLLMYVTNHVVSFAKEPYKRDYILQKSLSFEGAY